MSHPLHNVQITMYFIHCLCLPHVSMTIPSMNGKLLGKIAQNSTRTIISVPKVYNFEPIICQTQLVHLQLH